MTNPHQGADIQIVPNQKEACEKSTVIVINLHEDGDNVTGSPESQKPVGWGVI